MTLKPSAGGVPETAFARATLTAHVSFVVVYLLTAHAGLSLAYYQQNATLIWAPSGLAVAAIWRFGPRIAPTVFLSALATNLWVGSPFVLSAVIALGNTGEAWVAFLFGRRLNLREGIRRVRDVSRFVVYIVMGATLVAAVNGAAALYLLGHLPAARVATTGLIWWLGDAGGVLVVTPLVLAFASPSPRFGARQRGEIVAIALLVGASTAIAFGGLLPLSFARLPIALIPYPALVWASTRFGMRGSALGVAGVAVAAVIGTALGTGPFRYGNVHVDVAMLWLFMSTMAASSMLLATSLEDRTREVLARREADQWLALALDAGAVTAFERDFAASRERGHAPDAPGVSARSWVPVADAMASLSGEDRTRLEAAVDACRHRGHEAWECEYRDGDRWVSEVGRIIERDDAGAPRRGVGMRRDVTRRRTSEQQRIALEKDLEQTRRLGELGMLAGGVAHDFNNVLTIIRANTDFARESVDPDARTESLDAIEEATARAAELTEQLLAYAGRKPLRRRDVNVAALCAETVRLLGAGMPPNVALRVDAANDAPLVDGDPAQLRQVLMNLVWNASEAMIDRTGDVTVRLRHEGDAILLTVLDQGHGMDEATRARVFEPFFSTKPRGRGLGMAAVLGIVRAHGGTIDVESTQGVGTTFTVRLPATARLPRTSGMTLAQPRTSGRPAAIETTGRTRILVVDDEPAIRSIACLILRDADHAAIEATTGDDAERVLDEQGPFDVALLDMTMPDVSGLELMKRLARKSPTLRFVLMSGYSEDLVQGRAPAGVPFLAKPFRSETLVNRVREALSGRERPAGDVALEVG